MKCKVVHRAEYAFAVGVGKTNFVILCQYSFPFHVGKTFIGKDAAEVTLEQFLQVPDLRP